MRLTATKAKRHARWDRREMRCVTACPKSGTRMIQRRKRNELSFIQGSTMSSPFMDR